jgi:hypothetical protein
MIANSAMSSGVATLKWLVTPRIAWPSMIASSIRKAAAVPRPTIHRVRLHSGR